MSKKVFISFSLCLCLFYILILYSFPLSASAASSTYDASLLTRGVSSENEALFTSISGYGGCEPRYGFEWRYYDSNSTVPDDDYYYLVFIYGSSQTDWYTHFVRVPKDCCEVSADSSGVVSFSRLSSANMDFKTYHSSFNTDPTRYVAIQDFSFSDTVAPHSDNSTLNSEFNRYSSTYPSYNYLGYYLYDVDVSFAPPIEVEFTPDLSGFLSLSGVSDSPLLGGLPITYTSFHLKVINNTSDNYIYSFTIYDSSNNIVYRYLSYEWVYGTDIKSGNTLHPTSWRTEQLKGSAWHMVTANGFRTEQFNWSQIPLKSNVSYTAVVEASPNANPQSTNVVTMITRTATAENEEIYNTIDDAEVYYQSSFYISDFGSVSYDYSDTTNGIIPYKSEEDFARAVLTRKASVDNGVTDYDDYSAFDDPDSWYNTGSAAEQWELRNQHNEEVKAGLWNVSSSSLLSGSTYASAGSGVSGGSSYGSVSSNFGGFFSMLSTVFGYFPSAVLSMISFGISVLVVVAIIKKVFS